MCLPWVWPTVRQSTWMVVVGAQKWGAEGTVWKEISVERKKGDTILHVWTSNFSSGSVFEWEPGIAYKKLLFAVPDLNPSVASSGFVQHVFHFRAVQQSCWRLGVSCRNSVIQAQKYDSRIAATGRKRGYVTLLCILWWSEVSVHVKIILTWEVSKD